MSLEINVLHQAAYGLNLTKDLNWVLVPTEGTKAWLHQCASIMGLNPCHANGQAHAFFVDSDEYEVLSKGRGTSSDSYLKNMMMNSWDTQDFSRIQYQLSQDSLDIVCGIKSIQGDVSNIPSMLQTMNCFYQFAQNKEGLPLHGALVARDGIGVILAGSHDVGKSTCCRRIPSPWKALCDDETLLVKNDENQYQAFPFPTWSEYLLNEYSEKTWQVENSVPVKALFFLEQSKEDGIEPMGRGQTAVYITQLAIQVYNRMWNERRYRQETARKQKVFDNACVIANSIPAYKLHVSLTGQFWEVIETVL